MYIETPIIIAAALRDPDIGVQAQLSALLEEGVLPDGMESLWDGHVYDPRDLDILLWEAREAGGRESLLVYVQTPVVVTGALSTAFRDAVGLNVAVSYKGLDRDRAQEYDRAGAILRAALRTVRTLVTTPPDDAMRAFRGVQLISVMAVTIGQVRLIAEEGTRLHELVLACYVRDTL